MGTYAVILRFLVRWNLLHFVRRVVQAPLVAFSTSSSSATINMDGTAAAAFITKTEGEAFEPKVAKREFPSQRRDA